MAIASQQGQSSGVLAEESTLDKATSKRLTVAIERLCNALEGSGQESAANATTASHDLKTRALLLILGSGVTCKAEIARRLGVHRATIGRIPHLNAAIMYVELLRGDR